MTEPWVVLRADNEQAETFVLPYDGMRRVWNSLRGTSLLPAYALPTDDWKAVWTAIDHQSGYFLQVDLKNVAHVGHVNHSEGWLFTVQADSNFRPDQICARGNTIYLLDNSDIGKPKLLHFAKNCWAYAPDQKNPGQYSKVDEFSVAGEVRVVDPFSPRFICDGYGYMPFPSRPFLYDTEKHRTIQTLSWNTVYLFLDGDWLGPRLAQVR